MTTIEDEKIYDLAEIYFTYGSENTRLVSSDGVTVTYKIDSDDITDISSYNRLGTITKSFSIEVEIKGIVNFNQVRDSVAKAMNDKSTTISIGLYNKEPGATPVIDDILYDVSPSEIKVEKKDGNSCDLKCSAGYSKKFKPTT